MNKMEKIDDISNVSIMPLTESAFVKPLKMKFKQNGKDREWHLLKIHDSVCILIYNVSRKVLVFVKQFRPAVYYSSIPQEDVGDSVDTSRFPGERGITVELCAGIVDKDVSLEETARLEVLEECGYSVPASSLERIITIRSGIGISGDKQTLFYAEVTDDMRVSSGGGNPEEGECIDVCEMGLQETREYLQRKEVLSPGGFLFAVMWFFQNKVDKVQA
ncbi:uridine diphosphate glucose pyrophosphatase NUDT14-like [Bacillus rossius redtenbacheri]|uniref:uridine diphosphate glucose pyrophosphatase NUDT14-like n=1 Tax=Bacillus rossius redtenbacheri TaxID=93214 RepID=UPI002FDCA1CA